MFRVGDTHADVDGGTVRLEFRFACGETTFAPQIEFIGLRPDEANRVTTPATAAQVSSGHWRRSP